MHISWTKQLIVSVSLGILSSGICVCIVMCLYSFKWLFQMCTRQFSFKNSANSESLSSFLPLVGSLVVAVVYYVCPMTIGSGSIVMNKVVALTYANYESGGATALSELGSNSFGVVVFVSLIGKLVSVSVSLSCCIGGVGLLIPMVFVGLLVGALVSIVYPVLPVGYCLVAFAVSIPSGIYVLVSSTEPTHAQSRSFSVCSLIFATIPLCMVFIGCHQALSLYGSLLVCVVGLYAAMEHCDRIWISHHVLFCFGSSTLLLNTNVSPASGLVPDTPSIARDGVLKERDCEFSADALNNNTDNSDLSPCADEKRRFRLLPPAVASDLYCTHKRLLWLVMAIGVLKYFIDVMVRCCIKIY